ncbi:MAG: NAD-dependent epimerase/dehydratase family protein [Lentisphaeria bacterium]
MRVLITGGGGFLGRRVAAMLRSRGHDVAVFGRRPYPDLERAGFACLTGDLLEPAALDTACAGRDAVVHAAALAGVWGRDALYHRTNVQGTEEVIRACLRQGVSRLLFTSSPSVVFGGRPLAGADETLPYPRRHLAPYAMSKAAAEQCVLAANGTPMAAHPGRRLATCALRPHLIFGPGDPHLLPRIVELSRRGRLWRIGAGVNRVDITYVDNAAWAHLLALEALADPGAPPAGGAYFIGDAEPVCLWDWIGNLLKRLHRPPVRHHLSLGTAMRVGAVLERVYRLVPALGEPWLTRFTAAQLGMDHFFRHTRAQADFGYAPIVSGAEGVNRCLAVPPAGPDA